MEKENKTNKGDIDIKLKILQDYIDDPETPTVTEEEYIDAVFTISIYSMQLESKKNLNKQPRNMTLKKFIKNCSKEDTPIGDLANDILRDKTFPSEKTDDEIFDYLHRKTLMGGTKDTFLEFKKEYLKLN